MPKNKNNERKEKIKALLLKTLHVICYILSIAFIGICVFSGVQSCQKTRGVSAESIDLSNRNIVYTLRTFENPYFLSSDEQTSLSDDEVDCTYIYSTDPGNIVYSFDTPNLFLLYGNEQFSISYIRLIYLSYSYEHNNATYYKHYLYEIRYFFGDATPLGDNVQVTISTGTATMAYYNQFTDVKLLLTDYPFEQNYFDFYYSISNTSSFIFNKNFNYNAPMLVSSKSPYGTGVTGGTSQGTLYTKLVINCGYFVSNNQLFDSIEFWYMLSDGLSFDFDGTIKSGPQGMWSYWCTYYVNSNTNTMIIVNHRDSVAYMPSSSSYGYYQANSSTWSIDDYRFITFLSTLSDSIKDQIDQFNNNNSNYSNGSISGGSDIFSLLSMAFTSLIPFLSTNILPSISIGVLLFLPTIVAIIVIIFNLLRK